jgi:hypothetical protein
MVMTLAERKEWVREVNERQEKPVLGGLAVQHLTEPVGLDAAPTWKTAPDAPFADIQLCGGMLSGGSGSSSFRGKVYAAYVEEVTGVSLYENVILPDVVAQMAEKLVAAAEDFQRAMPEDPTLDERLDLARWFTVCATRGYGVSGWW